MARATPIPRQPRFMPTSAFTPATCTHLVEIKDQIQLAHIAKELVQHFDKEMDSLEIG